MELLSRNGADRLLPPGECVDIRRRLRHLASRNDLATVAVCAFDWRTRMLPFYFPINRMAPAGIRAIGSAMVDSGFAKTRIVLQTWNPHFRPSRMTLDGRMPDLLLISSMQIHSAACQELIRDAGRIAPSSRPLIVVGGPKAVFEPWQLFETSEGCTVATGGIDVAVTGEEYVLLRLLEVLLTERAAGEPLRAAFTRVRNRGMLEEVPGLVYGQTDGGGALTNLVDTGPQRLLGDLDELPRPALGYEILERPSGRETLSARPLEAGEVRRHSPIGSMVLTSGCRFSCPYCPIPAYHQRLHRAKSPARIVEEFTDLNQRFGMRFFFGTDDNFFNDVKRATEIVEAMARTEIDGLPLRRRINWGTEVTVHDTLQMRDHLRAVRKAGVQMLWLGVEDITGTFVKKGQTVDKTAEAFGLLRQEGISPVPMLMHHDGQPLYTRGSEYGLINQVRMLRKAGAIDLQVLLMTPAVGSKGYESAFESGQVIQSAGGREVEPYMLDGSYAVGSRTERPWAMQLRVVAILAYFYNPLRLLWAMIKPKSSRYLIDPIIQCMGMLGLVPTAVRMIGWAVRLQAGKVVRRRIPPAPCLPIRRVGFASTDATAGEAVATTVGSKQ